MPIAALIPLIQGLIAAAPNIIKAAQSAKEFIDSLFASKLITIEQQKSLKDYCDSLMNLANSGIRPDHWQVQPDPK